MKESKDSMSLAIVGLGYVGLPLAVAFGKKREVIGFDLNKTRVEQLKNRHDSTLELSESELIEAKYLKYTTDAEDLSQCKYYIIAVPTPIDEFNRPDLAPLLKATATVGSLLKKGDVVIYESTVYPGCTEECCVPILEKTSGLKYIKDFGCGYSPERINPGDKEHRLETIKKIISGSSEDIAEQVDELYADIILAGTYKAKSIRIAEAAKVIENTQRDLNIALVNELAIIFNKLHIDTEEVLKAAGTKWNFMKFQPGLVGGHCIGVDPYYLTHKAQEIGYHPEIILAGRRLNDSMGKYIASQFIKQILKNGAFSGSPEVLVMGVTFKENCPDLRNTKVIDIIRELREFGCKVDVYDPWISDKDAIEFLEGARVEKLEKSAYDGIIVAVAHNEFREMGGAKIRELGRDHAVIYDVKNIFPSGESTMRL